MLRVAWGIWLKDRITVADKVTVFIYSERAKAAKAKGRKRESKAYLKRIVGVLTGKRFVWLRDLLYLNELLDRCGMLRKTEEEKRSIEEMRTQITDMCADIGSRCNKDPHEIMIGMTDSEIESFSLHLFNRYYENTINLAAAHAAPSAFAEKMGEKLRENRSRIAQSLGRLVTKDSNKAEGNMPEPKKVLGSFFSPGARPVLKNEKRDDDTDA